ncbi:MAG: hypothetical protein JWP36_2934 [Paucimonas sp.]|nr:hypothetical protein [Paucimonas sp.]
MNRNLKRTRRNRCARLGRLLALAASTVLFGACATSVYENRFFERQVHAYPLENGQTLTLGFKAPPAEASCELVREESESWTLTSLAGTFKRDKGHTVIKERVLATVNARAQDGINHATVKIPNQYEFAGIPLSDIGGLAGGNQVQMAYYRCANPPQPS